MIIGLIVGIILIVVMVIIVKFLRQMDRDLEPFDPGSDEDRSWHD